MSLLTIVLEVGLATIGVAVAVGALFVGMSVDEKIRAHDEVATQSTPEPVAPERELVAV
ncbi:MAG: hypothetical protein KGJ10_08115 [Acidobacteriota bacterium]|nr:hypothetical protein [Acidobacteriota bacterium]